MARCHNIDIWRYNVDVNLALSSEEKYRDEIKEYIKTQEDGTIIFGNKHTHHISIIDTHPQVRRDWNIITTLFGLNIFSISLSCLSLSRDEVNILLSNRHLRKLSLTYVVCSLVREVKDPINNTTLETLSLQCKHTNTDSSSEPPFLTCPGYIKILSRCHGLKKLVIKDWCGMFHTQLGDIILSLLTPRHNLRRVMFERWFLTGTKCLSHILETISEQGWNSAHQFTIQISDFYDLDNYVIVGLSHHLVNIELYVEHQSFYSTEFMINIQRGLARYKQNITHFVFPSAGNFGMFGSLSMEQFPSTIQSIVESSSITKAYFGELSKSNISILEKSASITCLTYYNLGEELILPHMTQLKELTIIGTNNEAQLDPEDLKYLLNIQSIAIREFTLRLRDFQTIVKIPTLQQLYCSCYDSRTLSKYLQIVDLSSTQKLLRKEQHLLKLGFWDDDSKRAEIFKLHRNHLVTWCLITFLISFYRANSENTLKDSGLDLLNELAPVIIDDMEIIIDLERWLY